MRIYRKKGLEINKKQEFNMKTFGILILIFISICLETALVIGTLLAYLVFTDGELPITSKLIDKL